MNMAKIIHDARNPFQDGARILLDGSICAWWQDIIMEASLHTDVETSWWLYQLDSIHSAAHLAKSGIVDVIDHCQSVINFAQFPFE